MCNGARQGYIAWRLYDIISQKPGHEDIQRLYVVAPSSNASLQTTCLHFRASTVAVKKSSPIFRTQTQIKLWPMYRFFIHKSSPSNVSFLHLHQDANVARRVFGIKCAPTRTLRCKWEVLWVLGPGDPMLLEVTFCEDTVRSVDLKRHESM